MQSILTESSQLCNTAEQREGEREEETDLDQQMLVIST